MIKDDNKYLNMDLLRFTTAGSVDDGKSTLIGRLLYDSKSIFQDQLEAIELSSRNSGEETVNLALLTDGLRADREQKITIDVAYRYFATPRRKFIIADTPGHIQYTRNMVTGASTADLAIILIDARKGVLTQSKRHSFISSLLQIPHLVVAINKMDLVDYDQQIFEDIVSDFRDFISRMDVDDITYIPMSALYGDNIVTKSEKMPWYNGPTLLYHLEHVHVDAARNLIDFRFPVQYVIRPNQDFRGYAGRVSSGIIRTGDDVTVLPSRLTSKIKSIVTYEGELEEARAGDSIILRIEDELDISRGDMIVRTNNVPHFSRSFDAYLCWMNLEPLQVGKTYLLMQTTRCIQGFVRNIHYKIDVDTMHRTPAGHLELNEIGRVSVDTSLPLSLDTYRRNSATGSFILVDPDTNVTVGAGMVRKAVQVEMNGIMLRRPAGGWPDPKDIILDEDSESGKKTAEDLVRAGHQYLPHPLDKEHGAVLRSPNVKWMPQNISREERERRNGHKAMVLWLTGISGAGKTTISKSLERTLWNEGKQTILIDGDIMRHGLSGDLGFSPQDRKENIRRAAHAARALLDHGFIVICAFVSPSSEDRDMARYIIGESDYFEFYIYCDQATAQKRDPKGLYTKAKLGHIKGLTGYDAPYDEPGPTTFKIDTTKLNVEEAVMALRSRLLLG
jgi:bifunctional enzyme CysN/CysC